MKKQLLFTGFVFFIGLFLTGCASNDYVFDKSIPEENLSIIRLQNHLMVVKFDNKNVNWKVSSGKLSLNPKTEVIIKVPEGEHTLITNYYCQINYGTYTQTQKADGIELKVNFQPKYTYILTPVVIGDKISIRAISIKNKVE